MKNPRPPSQPSWIPPDAGPEFTTKVLPGIDPPAPVATASGIPRRIRLPDPEELAARVLEGDRAALSRAITLIESNAPRHRPPAREFLRRIAANPGRSLRIGISGVPGAGKSTFIEALGNFLCDGGRRIAVLAVDPSSSLSRGSILGDKTRMELLSRREECFIRPSPSGGALGGVARKTRETILACEAAGHDVVLVETVGVGQSEITVRSMVDCFLLLLIAGAGDDLQGMKRGIFEIADLVAVNKADGDNRARAEATRAEFSRVLHFLIPATDGWTIPVLACSALERSGISELWRRIEDFFSHVQSTGQLECRRRNQAIEWWRGLVDNELRARFLANPAVKDKAAQLEKAILEGRAAPSLAAEELLDLLP